MCTARCELLGFDRLYVACAGRFAAVLPEAETDRVVADDPGRVVLHTRTGSHRFLGRLSGEQRPRIC
jgi:hydrogenase expression/formation protein HypE